MSVFQTTGIRHPDSTTNDLFISSTGNIGIGTTSPDGTLHVHSGSAGSVDANGNANDLIVENSGAGGISILSPNSLAGGLFFGSPGDNIGAALRWNYDNDQFAIGPDKSGAHLRLNSGDGLERMRITDVGNVGIGTTSPDTSLEVASSGATGISSKSLSTQATDTNKALKVRNNSTTDTFNVSYKGQGYFAGRVGIEQTTPASALHVSGTSAARFQLSTDNTGHTSGDGVRIQIDSSNNLELLQRESANIEFFTNNTERMRIDSSGQVGINTSSPDSKLEVDGRIRILDNNDAVPTAGKGLELTYLNTADYADILSYDRGSSSWKRLNLRGSEVTFQTSGTERLRIDSSGHIMIGSTTDFANINCDDLQIGDTGSANTGITLGSSTQGQIAFADSGDSRAGVIHYQHTDNSLRFMVNGAANERMRINSSGNVGIGTTSPARQVHISDTNTAELHFTNDAIGNTSSDGSTIYVANTGELGIRNRENSFTTFYINNTERMRITSAGNVGIGTTSPASKLHIERDSSNMIRCINNQSFGQSDISLIGSRNSGGVVGTVRFFNFRNASNPNNDAERLLLF